MTASPLDQFDSFSENGVIDLYVSLCSGYVTVPRQGSQNTNINALMRQVRYEGSSATMTSRFIETYLVIKLQETLTQPVS